MRELAFVYLYRMDIKLLLYTEAFKKTCNLLFIELIEYYNFLFHREIRGRSVFSPKTTKRKSIEARNALLIKKSGMARAVMTPRARSRSWACECLAPPEFECKKNQAKSHFLHRTQTYITKSPDSRGNIVTRIRRSCTLFAAFPLREGKRSLQNRFSDFEALTGFSRQPR